MMEVYVKAKPGTSGKVLGDCPFSHRVLLTVVEKKVPYVAKFIDFEQKPEWFLDAFPQGNVPVIRDGEGNWLADSDLICERLETMFPEPSLVPASEGTKEVGKSLFGAFVKYITNKEPEKEDDLKQSLLAEVSSLNTHVEANQAKGLDFLDSRPAVCSVDLALYPKLKHVCVVLSHYKGLEIRKGYGGIQAFMDNFEIKRETEATFYPDEYILEGWKPKVGISSKM
ncbi:glutathione S-transferase [Chloropicon primus]|uniref:glutathione dehydrogenase (ascorbate) n=1 Tax=Chloropicon primus TaxID=1764295 RepID=A0A5B8MH45_9CHLO|nr:glutathione S-transferase [Chloropicon primus]|eukprot:QDZ19766.1 glutathione S-transferase [Chloropicon primus]